MVSQLFLVSYFINLMYGSAKFMWSVKKACSFGDVIFTHSIYEGNLIGPRIESWGTPHFKGKIEEIGF